MWCTPSGLLTAVVLLAQAGAPWSLSVDPPTAGQTPHWTLELSAPYCGGYRIGDGVYVRPEPPLALPNVVPDGSVLFQGQPGSVTLTPEALRIGPAPDMVFSQVCLQGDAQFIVELLPGAGLALPADPGTYAVDLWTGADPIQVVTLSFDVPPGDSPGQADSPTGAPPQPAPRSMSAIWPGSAP
jgi:hypothetical protein